MNELETIKENIKRMAEANSGYMAIAVQIKSVGDNTCSAMIGDLELTGIRLFSQSEKVGNFLLRPKAGSMATILTDSMMRDILLISADEIESFKFEENGIVIEFDSLSGKVDIKNNQVSLKELFQSLTNLIKQITVATPAGPSTTLLTPTAIQLTAFETSFKQLLK